MIHLGFDVGSLSNSTARKTVVCLVSDPWVSAKHTHITTWCKAHKQPCRPPSLLAREARNWNVRHSEMLCLWEQAHPHAHVTHRWKNLVNSLIWDLLACFLLSGPGILCGRRGEEWASRMLAHVMMIVGSDTSAVGDTSGRSKIGSALWWRTYWFSTWHLQFSIKKSVFWYNILYVKKHWAHTRLTITRLKLVLIVNAHFLIS